MRSNKELQSIIDRELKAINYLKDPSQLYEPIDYIMKLEAKRMRPILVLMAHQLFCEDIDLAISPALAIEVFHNFTLLHDDIMDKAPIRRGKKTVHEKWNTNTAILSGDTMLVQSYQLICNVNKDILKEVLDVFNRTAIQVCEGQQLDMDFETKKDVSISDYLKMVEYKTAVLLAAALQIGGITARASDKQQQYLYNFGKNMGIAFQLKDDLLDVFGDSKDFGKQIGGDILKNKKTYLFLKALELATPIQNADLKRHFSTVEFSEAKVKAVKSIFSDLNLDSLTSDLMKQYHSKAMDNLNSIQSENKKPLFEFAEILLSRIS